MARYRTIKPEFWTSEQVMECSTNARLLFIGTWNFCDDEGRHPWAPRQLKALIFPSDDISVSDVNGLLEELSRVELIKRYVVAEREYFFVTGWKHQKIDRKQDPRFPGPDDELSETSQLPIDDHSSNGQRPFSSRIQNTEENTEEKERELSGRGATPTRFSYPSDFEEFWKAYPKTPIMGKKEAYKSWRPLSAEDKRVAMAALPSYRAFLASKPDHAIIHACRFLSKRRFEGFSAPPGNGAGSVFPLSLKDQKNREWENAKQCLKNSIAADEDSEDSSGPLVGVLPPASSGRH